MAKETGATTKTKKAPRNYYRVLSQRAGAARKLSLSSASAALVAGHMRNVLESLCAAVVSQVKYGKTKTVAAQHVVDACVAQFGTEYGARVAALKPTTTTTD